LTIVLALVKTPEKSRENDNMRITSFCVKTYFRQMVHYRDFVSHANNHINIVYAAATNDAAM
jgi:hypothetical protein